MINEESNWVTELVVGWSEERKNKLPANKLAPRWLAFRIREQTIGEHRRTESVEVKVDWSIK